MKVSEKAERGKVFISKAGKREGKALAGGMKRKNKKFIFKLRENCEFSPFPSSP